MEYLHDEVELSDNDKVWVYFLKDHALKSNLSKRFLGDRDEEEVCFHPIKILIRHEGGKLEAVKVEDLQEEFGEDFRVSRLGLGLRVWAFWSKQTHPKPLPPFFTFSFTYSYCITIFVSQLAFTVLHFILQV